MGKGEALIIIIILFLYSFLYLFPTWRIIKRAGFNPALSLLLLIPAIGPIALMIMLAYNDWPVLKISKER